MSNTSFTKKFLRDLKQKELGLPKYSVLEEIINAITHGIGVLFAIAAIVILPIFSQKNPMTITCVTIYAATLFILYIASTLYHALGIVRAKKIFRVLDHCTIFVLIAGTYTPIALLMIGETFGWILFGVIWAAAIVGIILNAIDLKRFAKFSSICYLGMGWCVIFAFKPLLDKVSFDQIILLLLGGVAYSIGAVLYNKGKKTKYIHSIWHLFVLAGSIFHFFFILNYAIEF